MYFYLISAVAALGGLLFGYDTGVISGALLFIRQVMSLSPPSRALSSRSRSRAPRSGPRWPATSQTASAAAASS